MKINLYQRPTAGACLSVFVAGFAAMFVSAVPAQAGEICRGGSVVRDATNRIVGCAFTNWGPAEQSMCNGATVFAPGNNGPGTCHVCVTSPTSTQVAAGNYTGLTITPNPSGLPDAPTSFACLKCTQPPNGLTAWWTLDDASSGSVADLTGNLGLNGQLVSNPAVVAGQVGTALKFNGSNQYVEIPDTPQLNIPAAAANGSGDFSIDAWVKIDPATNASGVRVIVEKRVMPNTYIPKGYSFFLYNRALGLQLADGGTSGGYTNWVASSLLVPDDGQWHFVAVTISRSSGFAVQFTLDNKPMVVYNSPARNGSFTNTSPFRIGSLTIGVGSVFTGSIDEVEFFGRAVSYAEWQTIYNAGCNGKCRPPVQ